MTYLIFAILVLMPLAGCTNNEAGGPIISSLSTPMGGSLGSNVNQASNTAESDSDGEEDPIITMTSTSEGVTAQVTWNRPSDFNATGYSIHYGKRSSEETPSEELSSCSEGESHIVKTSPATISGLEPDTQYFFAIRVFNEAESICSNEITAVTPSAQS